MLDLISKYTSAHTHLNQLRGRQAALKTQNITLLRHHTLHRSHLSFVLRDPHNASRLSNVVAEQLAQAETSHERFIGMHSSAVCGLNRDEYRKLLLEYNNTQQQARRLQSSGRETQYKLQQLVIQMAVRYVKTTPAPWEQTQVSSSDPVLVRHLTYCQVFSHAGGPPPTAPPPPFRRDLPSSAVHVQPHVTRPRGTTQVTNQPPAKRARPPITPTRPVKITRKQVRSENATSPPDLHYPPVEDEVRPYNGESSNNNGQPTSPSRVDGSPNKLARPAKEQFVLVEVAASVQLIEENIPHGEGGRKCAICGYVDLLFLSLLASLTHVAPAREVFVISPDLTQANFQVLLEHLRTKHFKRWEKQVCIRA